MGCASSLSAEFSDNYPDLGPTDANRNNTGTNSSVVAASHGHSQERAVSEREKEKEKEKDKLRGDVAKRYEAKLEREKKLREKQRKVASAAKELSSQVLEEKEMLSLTSRSRATSRATSRAASPTSSRKQLTTKTTVPEVENEATGGITCNGNGTAHNGEVRVIS